MGFFDLASPILAMIDGWIDFLPRTIRVILWALLSSAMTMWLYKVFSRQDKLEELKPQIKKAQKELAEYDGEIDGLWPLMGTSLRLTGRQFKLALTPAILASLPVLFVIVFVANYHGYYNPEPDTIVRVKLIENYDDDAYFEPRVIETARGWELPWTAESQQYTLKSSADATILELPTERPSPVVHKRLWWNALLGNPGGYLDDDAPIEAVEIHLPWHEFLPWGLSWMRGWEFLYFTVLIIGSLLIKRIFKIH